MDSMADVVASVGAIAEPPKPRARRLRGKAATLPMLLVLVVFFVAPMLYLLRMSLSPDQAISASLFGPYGLRQFERLLTDPFFYRLFANSLASGLCTVVATLLLSYPVAFYLIGTQGWERTMIAAACLLPLSVNAVAGILGWYILLLPFGIVQKTLLWLHLIDGPFRGLRSFWALVGVLAYENVPFAVLILASSLQGVKREKVQAARVLGASNLRILLTVTLPLTVPGIFAAVVLTFSLSVSSYLVPLLIGGSAVKVLPIAIFTYTTDVQDWPYAAAMSLLLLVTVLAVTYGLAAVANRLFRRGRWEPV